MTTLFVATDERLNVHLYIEKITAQGVDGRMYDMTAIKDKDIKSITTSLHHAVRVAKKEKTISCHINIKIRGILRGNRISKEFFDMDDCVRFISYLEHHDGHVEIVEECNIQA